MGAVALSGGTSPSLRPPMLAMRGVSKTFGRARVLAREKEPTASASCAPQEAFVSRTKLLLGTAAR